MKIALENRLVPTQAMITVTMVTVAVDITETGAIVGTDTRTTGEMTGVEVKAGIEMTTDGEITPETEVGEEMILGMDLEKGI